MDMNSGLQKKVEKVIGKIHTIELLEEQGCTSEVRRVCSNNGAYLLKSAYLEKYRKWLKTEATVLENFHEKEIPIPKYHGFIEQADSSHLIMSFKDGITLTAALKKASSLTEKKALIKSFGQFLHKFHEKPHIHSIERENDWLDEQLGKAKSYLDSRQTEGSLELLNHLLSNKPIPVQQTMIHGDCTPDNVLVIDGKVQILIDVSSLTVGDPRYDESLAISNFINNLDYLRAFYEGYKRYKVSKEEFEYFDHGLYEFF